MKEKLKIQYSIEEKDFINFRLTNFIPSKFRIISYFLIGIILFSVLTNKWFWNLMTGNPIQLSDFSTGLFFVLVFTYIYYRNKRQYKSNEVFQKPMELEMSLTELIFSGQDYSARLKWSRIHKVKEQQNYFAIFTQERIANLISKSKLSAQEIAEMKTIFSKVPNLNYSPLD